MKSKFTILVCMLLSLFTYSQTFSDYCPMDESSIADPEGAYSYSMDPTVFQSTEPIVLNVFYW